MTSSFFPTYISCKTINTIRYKIEALKKYPDENPWKAVKDLAVYEKDQDSRKYLWTDCVYS